MRNRIINTRIILYSDSLANFKKFTVSQLLPIYVYRFHHLLDAEQECLAAIFFPFLSLSRSHLLVSHTTSSYYSSSHSTYSAINPNIGTRFHRFSLILQSLSLPPLLPCFLLSTGGVHRISVLLVSLPFQPQRSDIVSVVGTKSPEFVPWHNPSNRYARHGTM